VKAPIRCAIYTRKSSDEGLDQAFNSLDAQREACAAYVLSQAGEGWTLLPEIFDDGGFSGGNLERPAMKRLLDLVRRKQVDVIVVYKVDRLTRSLGDFARIVQMLDGAGASFVSVTQAFNTTTSMGRLTLNVLLSFAQFEREVTGERIRDKIAASKAKGMWMGGGLPLGYDADGRTLKINEAEAETVRVIYRRYLELASVHVLVAELAQRGVVSKLRTFKSGRTRGGIPMKRGGVYHLLSNRVYLGDVPHKEIWHPGLHKLIVDQELFDAVQAKLAQNRHERSEKRGQGPRTPPSPLTGKIFGYDGRRLSPVTARGRNGVAYRYYVDARAQTGAGPARCRLSAGSLETMIVSIAVAGRIVSAAAEPDWTGIRAAIERVEIDDREILLTLTQAAGETLTWPRDNRQVEVRRAGDRVQLALAARFARDKARVSIIPSEQEAPRAPLEEDRVLIAALGRAEAWKADLRDGVTAGPRELARKEGINPDYLNRLLRLAFLAPRIKRAVLDGRRPAGLTLERIRALGVDESWDLQMSRLAVPVTMAGRSACIPSGPG